MTKNSEKKLFPYFLFEIVPGGAVHREAVLILAVLFPSSPGREIDFSGAYQPRPEWYFLFLYQLTKYFPGEVDLCRRGAAAGLAFSLLLLAPFLDSGRATALRERKGTAAAGFGLLAIIVVLTVLSLL